MIRSMLGRIFRKIIHSGFRPYIMTCHLGTIEFRFFIGTAQAGEWYDPISQFSRLEYNWLIDNVDLNGQKIIDGGSHHGHYSVFLGTAAPDSEIVSVDPITMNLALTEVNMRLNGLVPRLERCVISNTDDSVRFENVSNGRIVSLGGSTVPSRRLPMIMPDATVVKLDIEGTEFTVLPHQIDRMASVHTWIVEIHARAGNPRDLISIFKDRGFRIDWVNRERKIIEPYQANAEFKSHHTTIFARL